MLSKGFWSDTYGIFQALEKVLIVVGVPIAAYWTYYTFATTETEKSRISYEVNLARAKNFGLQIHLSCSSTSIDGKLIVRGGVDVLNMGAELVRMDVAGSNVIAAYRLRYDEAGSPALIDRIGLPFLTDRPSLVKGQAFVAQRRRYLPFSFAPGAAGIYFIRFSAPVQFTKEGGGFTDPVSWGASTTIAVDSRGGATCGAVGG